MDELALPRSKEELTVIQEEGKRTALERARRAPFFRGRLKGVRHWRDIPILEKDTLRALSAEEFYSEFCIAGAGDVAHLPLPLGIHPAGQMMARAGEAQGVAVAWVGAGSAAPSPLSQAKRDKLAREWNARVFDSFGMTECTMMGSEDQAHEGFRTWSDLVYLEVLDPGTLQPAPQGAEGVLVVTPLRTNNATPFLRWNTGDLDQLVLMVVRTVAPGSIAREFESAVKAPRFLDKRK